MRKPDWSSGNIELYCGDCRDVIPGLQGVSVAVMDPPYGEHMGYSGDGGHTESVPLLGDCLKRLADILPRSGHVAYFWTMRALDVAIDEAKSSGLTYCRTLTMYLPKGGARPYLGWLPRTQPIILVQKYLPMPPSEFHGELSGYINKRMTEIGISRSELAKRIGCNSRLVMKWSRPGDPAWCLPTPRFYPMLKEVLELDDRWDVLADRKPVNPKGVREYDYRHDCYVVDEPMDESIDHPSPKPLSVMRHLVNTLSMPGETVIDPFMGSGTTGIACIREGRGFVGIEVDSDHFQESVRRISIEINSIRG